MSLLTVIITNTPSSGQTFLINQNFETPVTGYDNGETWVANDDTPNPAYTATPLRGAQSFYCSNGSGYCSAKTPVFSSPATLYGHFMFQVDAIPAAFSNIVYLEDSVPADIFTVALETSGKLSMTHGTIYVLGTTVLSINTPYHVWFDYTQGTGTNGTCDLYVSTTTTKPGTPEASLTTGTATTGAIKMQIGKGNTTGNVIFDQIYLSGSNIGNVPN